MAILNTVAQFGRYILRSRLSAASVCEVWLAEIDGAAGASVPVVFKKLRSDLAAQPDIAEAFCERARRAMQLRHDCIAQVLDVVVDRNARGVAMEFIDGKTLRQLISAVGGAGNALPIWFAIHVTRRICQALEQAHDGASTSGASNRLLHESLCPENVFLTFQGQVKVADFGLGQTALVTGSAPISERSGRSTTDAGWDDPQTRTIASVRNDLQGVGRILYELLTGICPPESGEAASPLPPSHYAPWVNVEVDQLLSRILSPRDPNCFQSAKEIRRALDEYLSSRRHDVSSTHVAGLVSVLFSPECRDSAPPTMRLQNSVAELAMRRSRRTTPPDFTSVERPTYNSVAQSAVSVPPSTQFARQTAPAPITNEFAEKPPMQTAAQSSVMTDNRAPERAGDGGESSMSSEPRQSPFRHDWDLALKRAREEAQTAQRASGEHLVAAAVRSAPPADPVDRAVVEFERGLEHMRRGEFELAHGAWERALEFDPQHRVCRANLSLLKKKLGSRT